MIHAFVHVHSCPSVRMKDAMEHKRSYVCACTLYVRDAYIRVCAMCVRVRVRDTYKRVCAMCVRMRVRYMYVRAWIACVACV